VLFRSGRGELVPANGLISVGDAAAFIDPFTGSGILLALESAKIAASVVADNLNLDFERLSAAYKKRYAEVFDKRLRVCSMLRHAAFVPFWAEATIAVLGMSVRLRRRIARATRFESEPPAVATRGDSRTLNS